MGTRLYPCTTDSSVICRLLNVSERSYQLHQEIEAWQEERGGMFFTPKDEEMMEVNGQRMMRLPDGKWTALDQYDDYGYALYCWRKENYPEVDEIENFQLYGWGRVNFPESWKDTKINWDGHEEGDYPLGSYCCGRTKNPEEVLTILQYNDVDLNGVGVEELGGLFWS